VRADLNTARSATTWRALRRSRRKPARRRAAKLNSPHVAKHHPDGVFARDKGQPFLFRSKRIQHDL
jgi:hypothetical protein